MSSTRKPAITAPSRFDNIDGLRAVAILSVLVFHYSTSWPPALVGLNSSPIHFPYGVRGVELFFAVSGYCISMSLGASATLVGFWAKRFARIQPAYLAGIAISWTAVALLGPVILQQPLWVPFANAVWLDYIPRVPMVDGAYWSLLVELAFYFWIGILYWLLSGRHLALAFGLFSLTSFLPDSAISNLVFFHAYSPYFLAGVIAFEWDRMNRRLGIALLVLNAAMLLHDPLGLLVAAVGFVGLRMTWLRLPRPIRFVGLISYPLYLVHQNLGLAVMLHTPGGFWAKAGAATLVAFAVAYLLHKTVELRWQRPLAAWIVSLTDRCLGVLPRRRVAGLGESRRW